MRRLAVSVYVFAAACCVAIALGGYTYITDLQNDRAIAALTVARQREINQFLRDHVCARFELRDEINIAILDDARRRAEAAGRKDTALNLSGFIAAIQNAQGECVEEIPGVVRR
jgi:hypothetical protein